VRVIVPVVVKVDKLKWCIKVLVDWPPLCRVAHTSDSYQKRDGGLLTAKENVKFVSLFLWRGSRRCSGSGGGFGDRLLDKLLYPFRLKVGLLFKLLRLYLCLSRATYLLTKEGYIGAL
jgi:hypothetical protein